MRHPSKAPGRERTFRLLYELVYPELMRFVQNVGDGTYADDVESAAVTIAERRGVWTTVVLTGEGGFSALCITDNAVSLFGKGMIGSVGKSSPHTDPGPREMTATALGREP